MRLKKKTKKEKKKRWEGGGRRNICSEPERCHKAIIMPANEKWNKVVGARRGEAEEGDGGLETHSSEEEERKKMFYKK